MQNADQSRRPSISPQMRREMTDQDLLADYRERGTEAALEEIIRRHTAMVFSVCSRTLNDPASAEDATQATFMAFWKRARLLKVDSVASWLYMVARNAARNFKRTEFRRGHREQVMRRMKTDDDREQAWDGLRPELDGALELLPAAQRQAIILRYFNGLSESEAAREVGCPEKTIRTRLGRGLEKLREGLIRRQVVLPSVMIGTLLTERAIEAAPPTLFPAISALCAGQAIPSASVSAAMQYCLHAAVAAKPIAMGVTIGVPILISTALAVSGGMYFAQTKKNPVVASSTAEGPVVLVPTSSDPLVNGDNFQLALNAAKPGDAIVLQAGASYQTRVTSVTASGVIGPTFKLPNKSCPPGRYVTIRTSALGSLPEGRISPANAGQMAQLATNSNHWIIEPDAGAGNYRFIGIEFTNTSTVTNSNGNTNTLVFTDGQEHAFGMWAHDLIFDRVWIHPYDDVTNPAGITRSAERGIIIGGTHQTIKNSYISGFTGFCSNAPNQLLSSSAIIIGYGPGPLTIDNNFIEAYSRNISYSGIGSAFASDSPNINPANTATISRASLTQAIFNKTATLLVGDYVAFPVTEWTTPAKVPSRAYIVVVDSIDHSTGQVTYHGFGPDAIANGPKLPVDGTRAQWRGNHLVGLSITRNTISKRAEWCTGVFPRLNSVWELGDGSDVLFEGNTVIVPSRDVTSGELTGSSPMHTSCTADRDGTTPWMTSDNIVIRSNYFRGLSSLVHVQHDSNHTLIPNAGNFRFTNNLLDGIPRSHFFDIAIGAGGTGWIVTHNTARGMTDAIFKNLSPAAAPVAKVLFQDNIVTSGRNFFDPETFFSDMKSDHNIIINNSGTKPPTSLSRDQVVNSDAVLGFANITAADAGGDYHGYALSASSPFKGRAHDGTDPGVNFAALDAALSGSGPPAENR